MSSYADTVIPTFLPILLLSRPMAEKKEYLMFDSEPVPFFQSAGQVNPRSEKYVVSTVGAAVCCQDPRWTIVLNDALRISNFSFLFASPIARGCNICC